MLGLWRSHSLSAATSSLLWRRFYVTSGHKLVANTGSRDSVSAPVNGMLCPEVTSDLDMRNTRQAYASKSSSEIVRGYFVFTLCSYEFLIKHQKELLNLVRRMLGRHLFQHAMRMTVFGQFMAGETTEEILKVARRYHDHGVRPMFAYTTKEKHGYAKGMVGAEECDELININHEAMQKCIELTKISPKLPNEYLKTSGKLTALGSADTFRSTTTLIRANNELLKVALEEAGTSGPWQQIVDAIKQLVTSQGEDGISHVATVTGFPLPTNFQ